MVLAPNDQLNTTITVMPIMACNDKKHMFRYRDANILHFTVLSIFLAGTSNTLSTIIIYWWFYVLFGTGK